MNNSEESGTEPPSEFICALTMDLMTDPVVSRYGQSFERSAIIHWLARGNDTCPMTRRPLKLSDLITNHRLRAQIRRWQIENDEDITVIAGGSTFGDDHPPQCFGFLCLPERDPDETERPHDDSEQIVEQPPRRRESRRSRRSTRRTSTNESSSGQSTTGRSIFGGLRGVFQTRRAVAA